MSLGIPKNHTGQDVINNPSPSLPPPPPSADTVLLSWPRFSETQTRPPGKLVRPSVRAIVLVFFEILLKASRVLDPKNSQARCLSAFSN